MKRIRTEQNGQLHLVLVAEDEHDRSFLQVAMQKDAVLEFPSEGLQFVFHPQTEATETDS